MRRVIASVAPTAAVRAAPSLLTTSWAPAVGLSLALSTRCFSMKEAMLAKRKAKENERLGIVEDEDDDDGLPMVSDEDQRRLSEEEAQRKKELEEATAQMLKEREAKDKLKKEKFKQWRAGQIQGHKSFREEGGGTKTTRLKAANMRTLASDVEAKDEASMEEGGDFKESSVDFGDIDEKRKAHRANKSEARRLERESD